MWREAATCKSLAYQLAWFILEDSTDKTLTCKCVDNNKHQTHTWQKDYFFNFSVKYNPLRNSALFKDKANRL